MTPQDQDAPRLQEILSQFYAGRIDRNEARTSVIDVVLARIGCARVSMWKFDGAEGDLNLDSVKSLLDAAFMLNGRAYGMVCCEETAAPRAWRAGDVFALRAIVTRLALLMSGAADSVLWSTPSRPLQVIAAEPPPPTAGP